MQMKRHRLRSRLGTTLVFNVYLDIPRDRQKVRACISVCIFLQCWRALSDKARPEISSQGYIPTDEALCEKQVLALHRKFMHVKNK